MGYIEPILVFVIYAFLLLLKKYFIIITVNCFISLMYHNKDNFNWVYEITTIEQLEIVSFHLLLIYDNLKKSE